jgi:hypothetical protein
LRDLSILRTNRKDVLEPYWQDEADWLCTVEFLLSDAPEVSPFYRGHHCLTVRLRTFDQHTLAGAPRRFLTLAHTNSFSSFASAPEKGQFLDLLCSNEDKGNDYIENDFGSPTN